MDRHRQVGGDAREVERVAARAEIDDHSRERAQERVLAGPADHALDAVDAARAARRACREIDRHAARRRRVVQRVGPGPARHGARERRALGKAEDVRPRPACQVFDAAEAGHADGPGVGTRDGPGAVGRLALKGVAAEAALEVVGPAATLEQVVARAAPQTVGQAVADQLVVATAAGRVAHVAHQAGPAGNADRQVERHPRRRRAVVQRVLAAAAVDRPADRPGLREGDAVLAVAAQKVLDVEEARRP